MPIRLLPSLTRRTRLVPVLNDLIAKWTRAVQFDPTWFVLLWRLKPMHPPSRG